jgi:hypothetical protein
LPRYHCFWSIAFHELFRVSLQPNYVPSFKFNLVWGFGFSPGHFGFLFFAEFGETQFISLSFARDFDFGAVSVYRYDAFTTAGF